jgi:hypothetical protein
LPESEFRKETEFATGFGNPVVGMIGTCLKRGQLRTMIDYIHANPVRRGLVAKIEDWEWSSAPWYAGIGPVKIPIDDQLLFELHAD